MPKSPLRKRAEYTPQQTSTKAANAPSPPWLAPLMVGLFLVGLAWIVVYYVSQGRYPIPTIDAWNLGVGFVFVLAGFGLATRWK